MLELVDFKIDLIKTYFLLGIFIIHIQHVSIMKQINVEKNPEFHTKQFWNKQHYTLSTVDNWKYK